MQHLPTDILLDPAAIKKQLYSLSLIVFGSKSLFAISDSTDRDEFEKLRVTHEINEATRLLISISVVMRNLGDNPYKWHDPIREIRREQRSVINVGVLENDDAAVVSLDFRNACNKIIHAHTMGFSMNDEGTEKLHYLTGKLNLSGTHKKKAWKAEVDIESFIRMAFRSLL